MQAEIENTDAEKLADQDQIIRILSTDSNLKAVENSKTQHFACQWNKSGIIGAGSQADVYLMNDEKSEKRCVLRSARLPLGCDFGPIEKECEILLLLRHPHIVVSNFYEIDRRKFRAKVYMEAMQINLSELVKENGQRLSELRSLQICRDLLDGLHFLHDVVKTLHRDITGSNVLIGYDGTAKLADFGISKWFTDLDVTRSRTGGVGSLWYMSPEVIEGRYSWKSDIWSVGCVLVLMICGAPPNSHLQKDWAVHQALVERQTHFVLPNDIAETTSDLISSLLADTTNARPTAAQALRTTTDLLQFSTTKGCAEIYEN